MDLVLVGGRVIIAPGSDSGDRPLDGAYDVRIAGGKIVEIGRGLSGRRTIERIVTRRDRNASESMPSSSKDGSAPRWGGPRDGV